MGAIEFESFIFRKNIVYYNMIERVNFHSDVLSTEKSYPTSTGGVGQPACIHLFTSAISVISLPVVYSVL